MFWKRKTGGISIQEMTPVQVQGALAQNRIVLVDVREKPEHAAEHIQGSLLHPLSAFNPAALPAGGKQVVLYCRSGMRSAKAVAACLAAGVPVDTHMTGGILAWKAARLPTIAPHH